MRLERYRLPSALTPVDRRFRLRTKGGLGIWLPDGMRRRVAGFQRRFGAVRYMDTAHVGAERYGPLSLLLSWPRYGKDRNWS